MGESCVKLFIKISAGGISITQFMDYGYDMVPFERVRGTRSEG